MSGCSGSEQAIEKRKQKGNKGNKRKESHQYDEEVDDNDDWYVQGRPPPPKKGRKITNKAPFGKSQSTNVPTSQPSIQSINAFIQPLCQQLTPIQSNAPPSIPSPQRPQHQPLCQPLTSIQSDAPLQQEFNIIQNDEPNQYMGGTQQQSIEGHQPPLVIASENWTTVDQPTVEYVVESPNRRRMPIATANYSPSVNTILEWDALLANNANNGISQSEYNQNILDLINQLSNRVEQVVQQSVQQSAVINTKLDAIAKLMANGWGSNQRPPSNTDHGFDYAPAAGPTDVNLLERNLESSEFRANLFRFIFNKVKRITDYKGQIYTLMDVLMTRSCLACYSWSGVSRSNTVVSTTIDQNEQNSNKNDEIPPTPKPKEKFIVMVNLISLINEIIEKTFPEVSATMIKKAIAYVLNQALHRMEPSGNDLSGRASMPRKKRIRSPIQANEGEPISNDTTVMMENDAAEGDKGGEPTPNDTSVMMENDAEMALRQKPNE